MTFTVLGPGLKDVVTFENVLESQLIEQPQRVNATDNDSGGQKGRSFASGHGGSSQAGVSKQAVNAYQQALGAQKERKAVVLARDIMKSPVVTLSAEMTILEAWQVFRAKRYRYIPVVDEKQQVVGLLSDRDLLRYAALEGRKPPFNDASPEAFLSIEPLYLKKVLTATPETQIREIARVLIEQRKGVMPIVDANAHMVGIITRSDILRTIVNQAPLELWV
ncbi:MAG: CBS domain-containing protein [Gammaproteobacteria bacterium]|nr:CBS domain-containing protein [Gammaproteobacteria bacterium]MDH5693364.1 CBS domain-containing protein [Gammaproteobacteria bacterium]